MEQGLCVPWGTDPCSSSALGGGAGLPVLQQPWLQAAPALHVPGACLWTGAPDIQVAAIWVYKSPRIPLQVMLVLEPERPAETLSRKARCALLRGAWGVECSFQSAHLAWLFTAHPKSGVFVLLAEVHSVGKWL